LGALVLQMQRERKAMKDFKFTLAKPFEDHIFEHVFQLKNGARGLKRELLKLIATPFLSVKDKYPGLRKFEINFLDGQVVLNPLGWLAG
jgi:ATP-dependent Clp protease ATP-binding subunit ClpA